jgi:hypothetical protein
VKPYSNIATSTVVVFGFGHGVSGVVSTGAGVKTSITSRPPFMPLKASRPTELRYSWIP